MIIKLSRRQLCMMLLPLFLIIFVGIHQEAKEDSRLTAQNGRRCFEQHQLDVIHYPFSTDVIE